MSYADEIEAIKTFGHSMAETTRFTAMRCAIKADSEIAAMRATIAAKDAEIASLREANRYLVRISNEAIQDASNYCEAQKGIARLREALSAILYWHEYVGHVDESWFDAARAALATVEGVGK